MPQAAQQRLGVEVLAGLVDPGDFLGKAGSLNHDPRRRARNAPDLHRQRVPWRLMIEPGPTGDLYAPRGQGLAQRPCRKIGAVIDPQQVLPRRCPRRDPAVNPQRPAIHRPVHGDLRSAPALVTTSFTSVK